jgi:hypothetical protein
MSDVSQFADEDPDAARLVNLRFFAGLTCAMPPSPSGCPSGPRSVNGPMLAPGFMPVCVTTPAQPPIDDSEISWRVSPETGH